MKAFLPAVKIVVAVEKEKDSSKRIEKRAESNELWKQA
jgi:hypothetical protein